MHATDFSAFRIIISNLHEKAFNEPISKLTYSKAQMLSWLIYESTGALLSYKSLSNYVETSLNGCHEKLNPNLSTLSILAEFVCGKQGEKLPPLARWWRYREQVLGGVERM